MKRLATALLLMLAMVGSIMAANSEESQFGPNLLRNHPDVTTYRASDDGVTRFVEGDLMPAVPRGQEMAAALSFFEDNKGAWRMTQPSEEMQVNRIQQDQLGMTHVRFDQYHRGVKVLGAQLRAHFDQGGALRTVNGRFEADLDVDINPVLTSDAAVERALEHLKIIFGAGRPDEPELVVFRWEGYDYLCWRTVLWSDSPMGRWEYLVDAHSGEVVFNANRIMDANDIGTGIGVMGDWRYHIDTDWTGSTYQMRDLTRRLANDAHDHGGQMPVTDYIQTNIASSSLPGSIATDTDNTWTLSTQAPAVDGHVYSALMYDYMLGHFGRNSFDGNGSTMLTSVNYSAEGDNNAYWNGNQIVIWSWSTGWRSLAGCPDVIAHEWGHAVTDYGSNLVYQLESGALNESFSDMLGAAFEFAHDSLDTPDWYMGENAMTTGNGFRDMENPHNNGDPDFYGTSDPYWVNVVGCTPSWTNDYCGVHTNSGVGNKWFSLLSDGGTHHSVTVTGIGHQDAILIAWRANEIYWGMNTTYHEAALGTISAANDLDPTGAWANQVANAWNAVGVTTPGPSLVFTYPLGLPVIVTPGAETTFEVVVSGSLGGIPMPGTGRIAWRIDGSGWTEEAMTTLYDNYYEATLPAINCGSYLEFYVRARESTTTYFYDPDPSTPNRADPATNVIVVFADDFETDQGWTVSGNAGDGQWDRGVPVGGGDRGDPAEDFDGSGSCYLTDNVDDNSDVDDGTTILTSPVIDLSVGDARVHYARWYSNVFGADPLNDEMFVYISNDDGGTWVLVETVGPVNEASGSWYENEFVVSDFVTPTSLIRLRIDVGDLGAGSVIEAAIDDVTVTVYECEMNRPQIVGSEIPDWTEGHPYSEQVQVMGGTPPYMWSDKFGDLIGAGLDISAGGLVTGTPVSSGVFFFTAVVTDDSGYVDEQYLTFGINPAVQVATTSLPDKTAGASYSEQLSGSGGTGDLLWSDKFGDLSGAGLSLSADGLVFGTPVAGVVSFTAVATDEVGADAEQVLSMTINPELLISTVAVSDGVVGVAYTLQLVTTGGTGGVAWTDKNGDLSGTGLSLAPDGLLSGTPSLAGDFSFTAVASDQGGGQDEKLFSLSIIDGIGILTASLPDWTVNAPYSQQLSAAGGSEPYTWIDRDGDLSGTGLSLSSGGLVSGTPTGAGSVSFWAQVTDDAAEVDERQFSFVINPELQFVTIVLPDWTEGVTYSEQIFTTGGTGAKLYTDQASELVGTGLSLSASGQVSGVPNVPGPISFTAAVTDEGGGGASQPFSFTINAPIMVTTMSLPDGAEDTPYSQQLESSGGTGAVHWIDLNAELVGTGLTLSEGGVLAGTPLVVQVATFTAQVTDDVGSVHENVLTLEIVLAYICGDVNNSGGEPDISDLVYLVDYMFTGGPAPPMMAAADFDGDGEITVSDLVILVDFMFNGGPEPTCE